MEDRAKDFYKLLQRTILCRRKHADRDPKQNTHVQYSFDRVILSLLPLRLHTVRILENCETRRSISSAARPNAAEVE